MPYFDRGVELYPQEPAAPPARDLPEFPRCRASADTAPIPDWLMPTANAFDGIQLPWLFLRFRFTLATPYASKDDGANENDRNFIVRDWAYKFPMVRPSTWKGCLRAAAVEAGAQDNDLQRLFGCGEPDQREGRLHFFPTLFPGRAADQIISPHDRVTRRGRAGMSPVTIRVVPAGDQGDFAILYAGEPGEPAEFRRAAADRLSAWLPPMFTQYGIGAKTLKGDGMCKPTISEVSTWPTVPGPRGSTNIWSLNLRACL